MSERKNIPEIRFKGFDGEWQENSLENMTNSIFDGTHQTPNYTDVGIPFFSVENLISAKSNKFISYEDYLKATSVNKAEKNDILITRIGNIGFSKVVNWGYPFSIYVTLAVVKQSKQFNSYFLNYNFQSSRYQNEILTNSLLSAVPCKINMNNLRKTKVLISLNLEEQTKIGKYFQQLDTLIALHQQKYDKLLNVKKAMLEKTFPKKGADVPEIRFKGFSEQWVERRLGGILKTYPFKPYITDTEQDGVFDVIQQGANSIVGLANGKPFDEFQKVVIFGDHTLSIYKPNKPFFIATDGMKILGTTEELNRNYFYVLLQKNMPDTEGYKRHFSILKEREVSITHDLNEQLKIGDFFKNLDTLLSLHQSQLEKLKNIKKACLEKMFV